MEMVLWGIRQFQKILVDLEQITLEFYKQFYSKKG
jgi:hypothetical protein